jgi:hypothetical protein
MNPYQAKAEDFTEASIRTALRTMCLWNGKTWETWESFKDRNRINELGYHGDMINGGPVFLEKYTEYFAKGIAQALHQASQIGAEKGYERGYINAQLDANKFYPGLFDDEVIGAEPCGGDCHGYKRAGDKHCPNLRCSASRSAAPKDGSES